MQDTLAGGVLVTQEAVALTPGKQTYSRRRRAVRGRSAARPVAAVPNNSVVQPGQLASPLMRFGFPSLAFH